MALTLSEQFRAGVGGRAFRMYQVTQDEATSTISAASIDLDQIEGVVCGSHRFASAAANTSTLALMQSLSITGNSDQLTIGLPAKVGSKFTFMAVGW